MQNMKREFANNVKKVINEVVKEVDSATFSKKDAEIRRKLADKYPAVVLDSLAGAALRQLEENEDKKEGKEGELGTNSKRVPSISEHFSANTSTKEGPKGKDGKPLYPSMTEYVKEINR